MARASLPAYDVADLALAPEGEARIEWAQGQMPVLARLRERFVTEYALPPGVTQPWFIAAGPDGDLYYGDGVSGLLVRVVI